MTYTAAKGQGVRFGVRGQPSRPFAQQQPSNRGNRLREQPSCKRVRGPAEGCYRRNCGCPLQRPDLKASNDAARSYRLELRNRRPSDLATRKGIELRKHHVFSSPKKEGRRKRKACARGAGNPCISHCPYLAKTRRGFSRQGKGQTVGALLLSILCELAPPPAFWLWATAGWKSWREKRKKSGPVILSV